MKKPDALKSQPVLSIENGSDSSRSSLQKIEIDKNEYCGIDDMGVNPEQ